MDFIAIALSFFAGLALFLYGVTRLADSFKEVAEDRAKRVLARFTRNPLAGVGTGITTCTLLDSSSVTIIILIAMVNAGLIRFEHSLGVVMGANIGTTISSQIYAFNVSDYAPLALIAGLLLYAFAKSDRVKRTGMIVFGLGLIFFGLNEMGEAAKPLEKHPAFMEWMKRMETPLVGALVGATVTAIIQSSSATLGIVIALASNGMITLPAGVAVMLGAEIGTCADTLIATIGRSREAVRVGVFHLFFNVVSVAIGLMFAAQLASAAAWLAGGGSVARQIANAHVLFNVGGVLLFLPFTSLTARFLCRIVPARQKAGLSGAELPEPA